MNLNQWAIKWGIPFEAVEDLRREFRIIHDDIEPSKEKEGKSEAAVQTLVRLEGAKLDITLWRNNVGVLKGYNDVPVRYGLANDSKNLNKKIKSSDLIGIRPVYIKQGHLGMLFGQFVAREIKKGDWVYTGNEEELAQLKFLELVVSLGGDACFANDRGTL